MSDGKFVFGLGAMLPLLEALHIDHTSPDFAIQAASVAFSHDSFPTVTLKIAPTRKVLENAFAPHILARADVLLGMDFEGAHVVFGSIDGADYKSAVMEGAFKLLGERLSMAQMAQEQYLLGRLQKALAEYVDEELRNKIITEVFGEGYVKGGKEDG